jgi:hypothetical protein
MQLPFHQHWLEQAIGEEREPAKIAQKIADHPEFRSLVQEAIGFAQQNSTEKKHEARVIAEHIAVLLHHSFQGYTTMH